MNAASTAPGKLTGEQYDAAAEAIRSGRVANLEGGRTAASLEELDAIRDWPVANVVDTSRAFEHTGTVPEVTLPNLIDTAAANALPLSDPQLVAKTSPPGTSATALNTADLPPEGGLKAPEGSVPDGTPVSEAGAEAEAGADPANETAAQKKARLAAEKAQANETAANGAEQEAADKKAADAAGQGTGA